MNSKIKIALSGSSWLDLTNDKYIGDRYDLVKYVNENKLTVLNQDTFVYKDEFWYNHKYSIEAKVYYQETFGGYIAYISGWDKRIAGIGKTKQEAREKLAQYVNESMENRCQYYITWKDTKRVIPLKSK